MMIIAPIVLETNKYSDQLVLSFVFKDGILQRLYDSQDGSKRKLDNKSI